MTASLTFLGAAGTVTGAKFLVAADSATLLLECGMFQGLRELRERNWDAPPVSPRTLAAVLLSHAHIDHSGYLPRLARDGFRGPIFCSAGTADLLKIMLPDAARLQEEEADFRNRNGATRHDPALPLFESPRGAKTPHYVVGLTRRSHYRYGADMIVVALGADHAGFPLKEDLKAWLISRGYDVVDLGTQSAESVDYPDYATAVGSAVSGGKADRGVLVCGTGIGMAMAANKLPGVRAAACSDAYTARMSREHNDANILALGARITGRDAAIEILEIWLGAEFAGGRHARRVDKIVELDRARDQEPPDAQAR